MRRINYIRCIICGEYYEREACVCPTCESDKIHNYNDEIDSLNEKFWLPQNYSFNGRRIAW